MNVMHTAWLCMLALACVVTAEAATMDASLAAQPQLTTSSRLLKPGETLEFQFSLPRGMSHGGLEIFPRYLEEGDPGKSFKAGGDLAWLDHRPREMHALAFADGHATFRYTPPRPGSYLARWRAGGETFYRYFAAVEDDWVVLRFSTFADLEATPTLHATGLPLDYRLPAERYREDDGLVLRFRGYHRHFGDTIIPAFADTPDLTVDERVARYAPLLDAVRALLPDQADGRTARIDMRHDLDPGYTETLRRLGVNEHCGLNEANARPWLGMPEFPYFSSPVDCRKPAQTEGATVLAHQWDFCGGWHFLGPVSWHYKASAGDWSQTEDCLRQGFAELANLAQMSGHPAFAVPLYDGVVGPGYPNPAFQYSVPEPRNFRGDLADAFIADRALSAEDVRSAMLHGSSRLAGILARWSPDDRSGVSRGHPRPTEGPGGEALEFDGAGDAFDSTTMVAPSGRDFTVGCWVRPGDRQRPWANLLSTHNDTGGRLTRGVSLEQDGDRTNCFYLIFGDGVTWQGTNVTTQLAVGAWQHFVVVKRGGKLTHYLDGKPVAEGDVPDIAPARATDPLTVADWARGRGSDGVDDMTRFVERYQRFIAFELPGQHKVAFARSIDIADYYRRHYRLTPRTVFVSRSDHLLYDMWWLCTWCSQGVLVPRDELPWETRISSLLRLRDTVQPLKDPLSREYLLVEDHRHSLRFERGCPNPIWWFDYTHQERGPEGSAIHWTATPDVDITRSPWEHTGEGDTLRLRMATTAEFPGYAICLWGLPVRGALAPSRVVTNADSFLLAHNTEGENHLVMFFDLKPGAELTVTIRRR